MQYFEYGIKKNGNYYIQKNNSIIQVYCQFDGMGYENCQDYFNNAYNESGYYWLYVNDISFKVYCDFSTGNASIVLFRDTYRSTFLENNYNTSHKV